MRSLLANQPIDYARQVRAFRTADGVCKECRAPVGIRHTNTCPAQKLITQHWRKHTRKAGSPEMVRQWCVCRNPKHVEIKFDVEYAEDRPPESVVCPDCRLPDYVEAEGDPEPID